MKTVNRIIRSAFTGAVASIGFIGVAHGQDKPTIYVVGPSLTETVWITVQNGTKQAATDLGANVVYQAPPQDNGDSGMIPLVQAAIAAKPAGIAIDYTSKAMEAVTKEALDAGIKVVLYNNNRFEGENKPDDERITKLAYVGQNEYMSGEVLANAWLPMLPKEACKILIVNPAPTAFVLTLRADGVKRILDKVHFPYADLAATGDQGQNLGLISAALQSDPSICGVVGLGTRGANPAAMYVANNGLKISVASFDVDGETAKYIEDGSLSVAINQQPFLQGYYAVSNLVNEALYSFSPVNVDTGTSIVTKDNVKSIQACISQGRC